MRWLAARLKILAALLMKGAATKCRLAVFQRSMFLGPGAKSKWLRYEYRISGFQVQEVSDSAFVVESSHRTAEPDTSCWITRCLHQQSGHPYQGCVVI